MRKHAWILALLILAGCKEISFREPQPRGRRALDAIPSRLQGRYLAVLENGQLSQDTIVINRDGYRFGYFDKVPESNHRAGYDEGKLGDALVFKSYRGYYFINLYQKPEWLLRIIQQQRNGDLIYMAMEQEEVDLNDYLLKLSLEIAIDSVQMGDETLYHIDPSPAKLLELVRKGYFTKATLQKIE